MSKWYRLDNAAKIFPPSRNKYDAKIFRFSCSLKENVDPDILSKALLKTLEEYPIFKSTLKRGFFWYYLEESKIESKVHEENLRPCSKFASGLLFEVTYYKKRINLEVNHALTDGTGTLIFLKSLVANYLNQKYKLISQEVINFGSVKDVKEDAFTKYKNRKFKKALKSKKAYQIKDDKYVENELKVIEGIVSVQDIKEKAKKYNATITEYLTSILIKSIASTRSENKSNKPIVITIPVNLRNYYPSYTVRNFFSVVNISYDYNDEDIETIILNVKEKFAKNLSKENVQNKMNNMATLEDIFILRLVPIFLKNLVLKVICKITDKYHTMTLSNIGIIEMPNIYENYIDYFDVFISTSTIQLCMCSYLNKMVLNFSSQFINSEIEKNFFRYLSSNGINVKINTNRMGDSND